MRKLLCLTLPLAAALVGCHGGSGTTGISGTTGSTGGSSGGGGYDFTDLPTLQNPAPNDFAVAAMAPDGRIGVAYYGRIDETHRSVDYLEVETDGTTRNTAIETITDKSNLSLAFDDGGTAYVAYFGNDPSVDEPHETNAPVLPDGGMAVFWEQSDVGLAAVAPDGTLTKGYPVHDSGEANGPRPALNNTGEVVGFSPAVVSLGGEVVIAYRDVHAGQFPNQDWSVSDWESAFGAPGSWQHLMMVPGSDQGGNFVHVGLGAATSAAVLDGKVLAVCGGAPDADAQIVGLYASVFDGTAWSAGQALFANVTPKITGNDGAGPKVASDPVAGFGVTWPDANHSIVRYSSSPDGVTWSPAEQAFGVGTGGQYPSLAFDPISHQPVIAFYICSRMAGVNTCNDTDDELSLAKRRTDGTWAVETVDPEGGIYPTVLFNGGQLEVVYRTLAGGLRIARARAP